jgi:hypothetical protein
MEQGRQHMALQIVAVIALAAIVGCTTMTASEHKARGDTKRKSGDPEGALVDLNKAIKLDPKDDKDTLEMSIESGVMRDIAPSIPGSTIPIVDRKRPKRQPPIYPMGEIGWSGDPENELIKIIAGDQDLVQSHDYFFTGKKRTDKKTMRDLDAVLAPLLQKVRKGILEDVMKMGAGTLNFTGSSKNGAVMKFTTEEDFEYPYKRPKPPPTPHGAGYLMISIGPLQPGYGHGTSCPSQYNRGCRTDIWELHITATLSSYTKEYGGYFHLWRLIIDRHLSPLFRLAQRINVEHVKAAYREDLNPLTVRALTHLGEPALQSPGIIRDEQAMAEQLLRLADSPEASVRLPAVRALVRFDDKRAVEKVLLNAEKHMRLVLQEAINVRPLSKAYVPMLARVLEGETEDESIPTMYALWALENTGSPEARELVLACAREGNHHAIGHLGGFPSESTVRYLISVLYETTENGSTSRQSAAIRALARMPDLSVPGLLRMLETDQSRPFSFARDAMHAIFRIYDKQQGYSFMGRSRRQWPYPDVEYRGRMVLLKDLGVAENRQMIARTWRNWWDAQLTAKKAKEAAFSR